jgi:NAD(P)-dependent dehydrogenase (short-subunit alcohol dehydrogenase family)
MHRYPEILITGGTSGLGLELVKVFLNKGYLVTALGRDPSKLPAGGDNLKFAVADFSDLRQTAMLIKDLCKTHDFDFIINNAGILSPPSCILTKDNLEITFQVNFLAHLLVNEIIISAKPANKKLRIFSVTSQVFRIADKNLNFLRGKGKYRPLTAYSESKLFLLMMNRYLVEKYSNNSISCIGFNPGIFSSGIKRTQNPVFRFLYGIAAPFMKSPASVAMTFSGIIENDNLVNGIVYNSKNTSGKVTEIRSDLASWFWSYVYSKIDNYLNDYQQS